MKLAVWQWEKCRNFLQVGSHDDRATSPRPQKILKKHHQFVPASLWHPICLMKLPRVFVTEDTDRKQEL
jgi:hypothetical protein